MIQGSGAICDHAGLPGGDAAIERHFEESVGDLVRRWVYAATLPDTASGVREALTRGAPAHEAFLLRLGWPLLRRAMQRGLRAMPADLAPVGTALDAELDALAARLGGRAHLVGDDFGRADLTAAALLAPLAAPPEGPPYGLVTPHGAAAATLARWRAHPALAWVRETYALNRR